MLKPLAIVSFFGLAVCFLLSELTHKTPPPSPSPTLTTSQPHTPPPLPAMRAPTASPVTPAAPSAVPEKLAMNSPALRNRLEEQIPRQLYAEAARCYRGGLNKDQRLDVTYRLHVADGEISVSDVRTIENTLEDSGLERCIREKILAKKWRDDVLPNLDEDDDLYMRVGGLQGYVAAADRQSANP